MKCFYHTPAHVAFCHRAMTLQVLLPDEGRTLSSVSLSFKAGPHSGTLRMLPTDGYRAEQPLVLYSATIPAEQMEGEYLEYTFDCKQCDTATYRVPLRTLPEIPPVLFTEYALTIEDEAAFCEITNPRDEAVDLYDYEMLLDKPSGLAGRNPLADRPGVHVLAAGETAVLRFVHADRLLATGSAEADVATMWKTLADRYPQTCDEALAHTVRVISPVIAVAKENGFENLPGTFRAGVASVHRLLIVPRGGTPEQALTELRVGYDGVEVRHAAPHRYATIWTVDLEDPAHACQIGNPRRPTPGFADEGQVLPFVGDHVLPVILPLEPTGSAILRSNELVVRFAVLGNRTGRDLVFVMTRDGVRAFLATVTKEGVHEARIPVTCLDDKGTVSYWIEAQGGLYRACLGNEKDPITVRLVDKFGPVVASVSPADGEALEKQTHPTVTLQLYDFTGVDTASCALFLDGRNVSASAEWSADGVSFCPKKALTYGEHVIEATLRDVGGNRSYFRSSFTVHDGRELQLYRGEVHTHTADSDGMGTPEEAMTYARDVGKVDYFAVTEHCMYMSDEDIVRQHKIADSFNEKGKFAALFGYELSWGNLTGFYGHMNVLNTDRYFDANHHSLYEAYEKLADDPDAIAMFNHPCEQWGDFDSFGGHTPVMDRRICLAEIKRKSFDTHYALLLARGWHAAPLYNEDNHQVDWTTKTTGTGVVLAHSLSRENVLDAFRRGRTYSTTDNTMRIRYRVNGEWLGARLQNPKKLSVEIEVSTERDEGIGEISLLAEDSIVVARTVAGTRKSLTWRLTLTPDFDYYYLRIINGETYAVTSPVFVEGRDALTITDMRAGVSENPAQPHAVSVTLQNTGKNELVDVWADFYLTPENGFALRETVPFKRVKVGALPMGENRTVTAHFPNAIGNRRVSAVVYGTTTAKQRFADTRYLLLSPAIVTKLCALTKTEGGIDNPFAFIELYNHTAAPMPLAGYALATRHFAGTHRPRSRIVSAPLTKGVIPPLSHLVIWQRLPGNTFTVADFNAHFGTSLVEGKDLLVTEEELLRDATLGGHRFDLVFGEEMLTCATYGNYGGGAYPEPEQFEYHVYGQDMGLRTKRIKPRVPAPIGTVTEEQVMHVLPESPLAPIEGVQSNLSHSEMHPILAALTAPIAAVKKLLK